MIFDIAYPPRESRSGLKLDSTKNHSQHSVYSYIYWKEKIKVEKARLHR
jgi:hypothetical protein